MTPTPPLTLLPRISLIDLVARIVPAFSAGRSDPAGDAEQSRARRAFVLDRLADNSEAFASEHDVQAMMCHYPRDF